MHHQSTLATPIFELAEELVASWSGITKCTAKFLRAVGEFDRRHGYEKWGYVDTAQWLDAECGISQVTAREKVRVARELEGLGKIAEAFADGALSYSKVRALTRLADLGNEGALLDLALKCPASELEARLREMENGGALSSEDGEGKARHTLKRYQGNGDRVRISVELAREDAGIVMQALEVALCQLGGPRADDASLAADALLLMARRTLSGCVRGSAKAGDIWFVPDMSEVVLDDPTPEQSGPARLVTVHVEQSVLRGEGRTSDLPTPAVRRLLCDGAVVGIVDDGDGSPLCIGHRTRTVPVSMRRALKARDRTCRYPGCHHGRWLDAHHVVHWADGGETNLDNLVLLCTHHHKLLHDGKFEIRRHEAKGHHYFARPGGKPIGIDIGGAFRLGEEFSALRTWGQDAVDPLELWGVLDDDCTASAEAADEVNPVARSKIQSTYSDRNDRTWRALTTRRQPKVECPFLGGLQKRGLRFRDGHLVLFALTAPAQLDFTGILLLLSRNQDVRHLASRRSLSLPEHRLRGGQTLRTHKVTTQVVRVSCS